MSCPHTSQQNGKAERALRIINNIVRSMLFQASLPPVYWADSLHTATYLLNRHPTKTLGGLTPFFALFGTPPTYSHLRVFGCACYPNLSSTAPHKLSPRSSLCVFLGYSSDHKGYRCLDLQTNRIIISRHVIFDESIFPISNMSTTPSDPATLDFLDDDDYSPMPIGRSTVVAGTPLRATGQASSAGQPPVVEPVSNVGGLATPGGDGDTVPPETSPSAAQLPAVELGSSTGARGAPPPPTHGSSSAPSAAPVDTTSQVAASRGGRTASALPQPVEPVINDHGMQT
jgi:hypothetical protein